MALWEKKVLLFF